MVLRRYNGSASSRIGAAVTLRALGVLVRRHPKAAMDVAGAGLVQAGKSGWREAKRAVVSAYRQTGEAEDKDTERSD